MSAQQNNVPFSIPSLYMSLNSDVSENIRDLKESQKPDKGRGLGELRGELGASVHSLDSDWL